MSDDCYMEYKCDGCGHETDTSQDSEFDCPHCGTKMEEVN